jgi:anti-sigma B factor antagonist
MVESWSSKVEGDLLSIAVKTPRLDAKAAADLKSHLPSEIVPEVRRAEVDLEGVAFIDSSGVGVLLSIYRKLPSEGAQVVLRNLEPGVRSTLELLRLHRVFLLA